MIRITALLALLAAAAASFSLRTTAPPPEEDICILDGPGSYIECMTGTVEGVSLEDEYCLYLTLRPDEDSAYQITTETCLAVIEAPIDEDLFIPLIGDRVSVFYPGEVVYHDSPDRIISWQNAVPAAQDTEEQ